VYEINTVSCNILVFQGTQDFNQALHPCSHLLVLVSLDYESRIWLELIKSPLTVFLTTQCTLREVVC
jgi:hypothetical protein